MFDTRKFIAAVLGAAAATAAAFGQAPAASPVSLVGRIEARDIEESSGLVASRRHPGIFYTHNDSGGAPVLYAIKADGSLVKQYRVPARHTDWEDITTDDAGRLYVADTGNNNARRDSVDVFRLAEPNLSDKARQRKSKSRANDTRQQDGRLRAERTWKLTFPGEPFNCESLFVRGRHAYLVSKMPEGQRATIYRFAIDGESTSPPLEKVTDLTIRRPVTGASLSADGKRLALVSGGAGATLYLYDNLNGDVASAGSAEPKRVPLPPRKIEAVAFTPDGILMTAETREIYRYADRE
jgi:hypothetical protein